MRKVIPAILFSALWIVFSEFIRNELFLKSYWVEHYQGLGLTFPSEMINNAMWALWSLCVAVGIYFLSRKFSLIETTFIAWFFSFLLMWFVTWNMAVFPVEILVFAIPLSLLEAFFASWIILKLSPPE